VARSTTYGDNPVPPAAQARSGFWHLIQHHNSAIPDENFSRNSVVRFIVADVSIDSAFTDLTRSISTNSDAPVASEKLQFRGAN
jgi:hypothetical protein